MDSARYKCRHWRGDYLDGPSPIPFPLPQAGEDNPVRPLPHSGRGKGPIACDGIGEGMREGQKLETAKQLRVDSTPAEKRLWEQLRNRQMAKQKFRRQVPVGPYIVDFVCLEKKLIIEIDGWTHSTEAEILNDKRRTSFLESQGFKIIRFQNIEIKEGLDEVLTLIAEALK